MAAKVSYQLETGDKESILMIKIHTGILVGFLAFVMLGCEVQNLDLKSFNPLERLSDKKSTAVVQETSSVKRLPLESLIKSAVVDVDFKKGFKASVNAAVLSDPIILQAKKSYDAQVFSANAAAGQKEFQVFGTLYGGIEDITDEQAGLALVLNASRTIFDGGILDNAISAEQYAASAAKYNFLSKVEERTLSALRAWIELERYQELNELIESRLSILNPLIDKLEQVAAAGVGDVSQVAAAQRTVSLIRVTQTDVQEKLKQAKINFFDHYGVEPVGVSYEPDLITGYALQQSENVSVLESPIIKGGFASYQAALAALRSVEAKNNFTVSFESKFQRPLGESGYDSDESVGLVVRRTFYDGDKLKNQIDKAKSEVEIQVEFLKSNYRKTKSVLEASLQTVASMDKAIELAEQNALNAKDEIAYLRQQLIIGQSTLDSVLTAEARLYDNESSELNFLANRRIAEVTILASKGALANIFEIK